ncbi:MAG: ParA family protein, partial [Cyanobacteria bacterium J06631_2]
MLKIAVFNFKGGTGKSTSTLNLGACLATSKRKVLLIDLDGQRTLSFGLGLDGETPTALDWLNGDEVQPLETKTKNLRLIPGDIGMFQLQAESDLFTPALDKLKDFDVILMDCPPGLGIASVQAILASDRVLTPVVGEPAVLKGLSEAIQLIKGERPDVPIDVARVRYRSQLVITREADELLKEAAGELDYTLLKTLSNSSASLVMTSCDRYLTLATSMGTSGRSPLIS